MRIAIGNDHGGLEYKNRLLKHLEELGHEVINVGTDTLDSVHYPVYAKAVGELVASKMADFGILICTTGEGIMMAANKVKGVRAGVGYADDVARLMREHNDANIIAFGEKYMEYEDVERRVDIFINTPFSNGERHALRVKMIEDLEK